MKTILSLLLLLTQVAFADSTATSQFTYDGSSEIHEVNMTTEKTRIEYRQVRVRATCYRTEYRTRCGQGAPVCRQVCRQNRCSRQCVPGRRVCRNVPVSIPYSCTRIETRSFEVHDYDVITNAQFIMKDDNAPERLSEVLTLKVTGDRETLTAKGSKNYFIVLDKQSRKESSQTGVKYIDLVYNVKFVSAVRANEVLANGITNVKLRNGVLNFTLGAGFSLSDFSQQVRLFKNRRLGSDTLLLNRMLSSNELNVITTANASNISINFADLGVKVPSKARIILDTKYLIDSTKLLNLKQMKISENANWVFR